MPPIDCSSSAIREACRAGNPLTGLVDEKVEEYIIANELYKDERARRISEKGFKA